MRSLAFLVLLGCAGCANSCNDKPEKSVSQGFQVVMPADAKAIFENADQLEIFATAPESLGLPADAAPPPDDQAFHGHRVVGHARIDDPKDRKAILDALLSGIAKHKSAMVACNEPRHGFRVSRGAERADIHMSFGCLHGTLYAKSGRTTLLTAPDSKDEIDELFAKYKVPSGK